ARERYIMSGVYPQNDKNVVTTGGSGFGILATIVGMDRGCISQPEGVQRLAKIVGFLESADRIHWVWPRWLDGGPDKVRPFGTKGNGGDLVETSFLVQGLITARQYLRQMGGERETALAAQIDTLWQEVEWDWYRKGGADVLYWHWSPEYA